MRFSGGDLGDGVVGLTAAASADNFDARFDNFYFDTNGLPSQASQTLGMGPRRAIVVNSEEIAPLEAPFPR